MMQKFVKLFALIIISSFSCTTQKTTQSSPAKNILLQINGEPVIPRNAVTINVTEFEDCTEKFRFTNKLTAKVREFLILDGRLAVVAKDGDLTLQGSIISFHIQPQSFTAQGIPVKKRILLISKVTLIDSKNNKILFHNQPIQSFVEYSDQIPPITPEIQAIEQLISKLAERIQVQTIHGWYTTLMTPVEKGKK